MTESKYRLDLKLSILYSLVSKIITILSSIILLPLTLHSVGVENFAIFNITIAMVGWVFIFSGGFSPLLVKTFSTSKIHDVRAIAFQLSAIATVIIITFVSLILLIFYITSESSSFIRVNAQLIFIVFLLAVLNVLLMLFNAIRQGENNQHVNTKIATLANLFSLIFMFFFYIFDRKSLVELAFITFGFTLIFNAFYLKSLLKKHFYIFKKVNINFTEFKKFFLTTLFFIIIQVSVYLNQHFSILMTSEHLHEIDVSKLTFIFRYFLVLGGFITMIYMPIWPSISNALSTGNFSWIKRCSRNLIIILSLYGLSVFVLTISSGKLIFETWSGSVFTISKEMSFAIGFYFLLICLYQANVVVLTGLGKISQLAYTSLFENVTFIAIIFVFKGALSVDFIIMTMICVKLFFGIPMSFWLRSKFLHKAHNA